MRAPDAELLRSLPLFKDVQPEHFDLLATAGYVQRFPAHVTLIREGEPSDFLHILIEGTVELLGTHQERETTLTILRPTATFILAAVILDQVYLNSVRTASECTIAMIPGSAVRDVFDRDTAFARATVRELAGRYRAIVKDLKNVRLRTGLERLAGWILTRSKISDGASEIEIKIGKKSLAAQLGMRPEHLSRSFAELTRHGVRVQGRRISIVDATALERLAMPDPLIDEPD